MDSRRPHPWFAESMQLLDLRDAERVLVVTATEPSYVEAASALVGPDGTVRVIEPNLGHAEAVAALDLENVEVAHATPEPGDRFGSHDAMLACPLGMPLWPASQWADLAVSNLRPGGRFVVDVPAECLSEDLVQSWTEVGGDPGALQPLHGLSERALAATLRARNLRQVEAVMATHLLAIDSPGALAETGCALIGDTSQLEELSLVLTQRLRTHQQAEVIIHRTRVHGRR